jgi:mannose-1-phosphate guanylyltransferase
MMPVFGIPIIQHNLIQLREQGIREVIVNLHHMPVQIIQHLKDGSHLGVKIHYSLEPTIMGTAGGIKKVERLLQDGTFLVVNADTYRVMDLKGLLRNHRKKKRLLTLLLQENRHLPPERAVWVDRFLDLYRKDVDQGTPTNFLGVQAVEPEFFSHIPPDQPWEIQRVYVRLLSSGLRVGGHLQAGYWKDLGSLNGYWQIHVDTLDGICPLEIPGVESEPGVRLAEGATLGPGARIDPPVYLGPGSRVGKGAWVGPYAILGGQCVIERGARVVGSILWDGVRVQENGVAEGLLVGRDFQHPLPPM